MSTEQVIEIVNQDGDGTGLVPIETGEIVKAPTKEELALTQSRLEQINNADIDTAKSVVSKYWEPTKGDKIRGIFAGWKILQKKETDEPDGIKRIPCVVIKTQYGDLINGSMQLVETFMSTVAQDTAVYVECLSSKAGKMKEFDVRIINEQ